MAWPLALFAASQMLNTYGKMQADEAQAEAEKRNASYYREQGAFTEAATFRESSIFLKKSANLQGQQLGAVAKGGISLSGDMLQQIAGEKADMQSENNAILMEGAFKAKLAYLRADQADQTAASLTGPGATLGYLGGFMGAAASAGKG